VSSVQFRGQVNQVIEVDQGKEEDSAFQKFSRLRASADAVRKQGPWDLGVALPNSFSAAILLKMAGAKEILGYRSDARSFLLTHKMPWNSDPNVHRADAYRNLLTALKPELRAGFQKKRAFEFWETEEDEVVTPFRADIFPADKEWTSTPHFPDTIRAPYWVLAPGATADSRRWPTDRFLALAKKLRDTFGWQGVIVGGPAERRLAQEMIQDTELGLIDLTASCSVGELWKIFRNAQLTVCNESGLSHVASLSGSNVHVVCGAADPRRTRPIGPGRVTISMNPVDCWPCERNVCLHTGLRKNECLEGISVERVQHEIESRF
jgi:ADP-heptose:LPS heptosyltransferase